MSDDPLQPLIIALGVTPDNTVLRAHVVRELLKSRRWRQAAEVATPLQGGEQAPLALLAKARLGVLEGDLKGAREAYQQAIASDRSLIDEGLELELSLDGPADPIRVPSSGDGDDPRPSDIVNDNTMRISFADIGGMEALKDKIRLSILLPILKPEVYAAYGKKVGGGLLLYGPPGCGKTHIARATAGELGANFYVLTLNDILSKWMGESEKQLAALFEKARQTAPSVIFIDETDALGSKRSDMRAAHSRQVVSQFLTEMDGIHTQNNKVMVLGATNMPWNVDSALRRPGRFDRVLFVPPPDLQARQQILQLHCRNRKLEANIPYAELAAKTEHFSGADLAHLVEVATERALVDALKGGEMRPVTGRDFQLALKECRPTTMEWLRKSRNYVNFANQDGLYNDLETYLEKARIR